MKIKLLTTVNLKNWYPNQLDIQTVEAYPEAYRKIRIIMKIRKIIFLCRKIAEFDVFLVLCPSIEHIVVAGLHRFIFRKVRVVFLDIVLQKPKTGFEKIKTNFIGFFLKGVDAFLLIHKDYHLYNKYYGIPMAKVKYIAFKANNYEIRNSFEIKDEGYVLSCGASFRDYDCLIEAARKIPDVPFIILKPSADFAALHKIKFEARDIPTNVSVMTDDMSKRSWNLYIAGAKIVVIPIHKDCIQPAGISTYLEAMALSKSVIISRGPSTEGLLLDSNTALLYEPGNAEDLYNCILKLLNDDVLRSKVADNGHQYALCLEGLERFVKELEQNIIKIHSLHGYPRNTK